MKHEDSADCFPAAKLYHLLTCQNLANQHLLDPDPTNADDIEVGKVNLFPAPTETKSCGSSPCHGSVVLGSALLRDHYRGSSWWDIDDKC